MDKNNNLSLSLSLKFIKYNFITSSFQHTFR